MIPWKLLAFIAVMALVLVFVGFNLDNRCDISLVFVTFRSVPVVITILSTYVLGLLSAFFLSVGRRGKSAVRVPAKRNFDAAPIVEGKQPVSGAFHGGEGIDAGDQPAERSAGKRRSKSGGQPS